MANANLGQATGVPTHAAHLLKTLPSLAFARHGRTSYPR